MSISRFMVGAFEQKLSFDPVMFEIAGRIILHVKTIVRNKDYLSLLFVTDVISPKIEQVNFNNHSPVPILWKSKYLLSLA
jgi:hypothetical protein